MRTIRKASPARLERVFALIVGALVPAAGALVACGGSTQNGPASDDGGGSSSSGASSGGSSSGFGSSSGSSSSGSSSGSSSSGGSSSGSSSGVCGGCGCTPFDVTLDGGLPDGAPTDGGYLAFSDCQQLCNGAPASCHVLEQGPPIVVQCQEMCLGRRPEGFGAKRASGRTAVGAYFAQAAQLEAASVPAFRRMARELSRHGAPRRLVKAAERAAREEVRHARGALALARRHGATVAAFTADVRGERSLEEFAIENAVEGCVRETYGALVATWQAREASDPLVRAHMKRIAKEETTHAALAMRTDAWARGRLSKDARARVEVARAKAARELVNEAAAGGVAAEVATVAGLPRATAAERLARELVNRLVA